MGDSHFFKLAHGGEIPRRCSFCGGVHTIIAVYSCAAGRFTAKLYAVLADAHLPATAVMPTPTAIAPQPVNG